MCVVILSSHLALALSAVFLGAGPQRPEALVALQEARRAVISGRVEWTVAPRWDMTKRLSFVSRYAKNGDMIFEVRGDQDGWVTRSERPSHYPNSRVPQIFMRNREGSWYYQETSGIIDWWGEGGENWPDKEMKDVRAVGIYPTSGSLDGRVGFGIWDIRGVEVRSWEQERVGDNYMVTMVGTSTSGADCRLTWEINPDKGWNAERIVFDTPLRKWEAVCGLKQFDDTWLPAKTDYLEDGNLVESVEIVAASVNQPSDPAAFTPGALDLEPGTNINGKHLGTGFGKVLIWNGDSISTSADWFADVKAGRRQWGPTFQRIQRGEHVPNPYLTDEQRAASDLARQRLTVSTRLVEHEGLWQAYVEQFIARYQLNKEQSEKAWKILAACRERAQRFLSKHRAELTSLHEQINAADKNDKKRIARLEARLAEARAPIDKIFEEQLKPRLDKLPTRAQRKAADAPNSP